MSEINQVPTVGSLFITSNDYATVWVHEVTAVTPKTTRGGITVHRVDSRAIATSGTYNRRRYFYRYDDAGKMVDGSYVCPSKNTTPRKLYDAKTGPSVIGERMPDLIGRGLWRRDYNGWTQLGTITDEAPPPTRISPPVRLTAPAWARLVHCSDVSRRLAPMIRWS